MTRYALVTGASRGIGKAIKERFIQNKFEVIAPSREELDLLSDASIDNFIKRIDKPIDILINNAGINILGAGEELKDEDLLNTLQINLIGPIRLSRGLIPGMIDRKYGRIVNISSIWSLVSKQGRLSYSVSKTGLNGFTRSLAIELAPYNILVNAIAPGFVNTELTRKNNSAEDLAEISKAIPMHRLANPEEIAEVVFFLSCDLNTYLTGQVIAVDGGYICR